MIDHLADADGHIIEPGDLWAERLPNDLRPLGPRFYRDAEGVFHSRIYAIELDTLPVMPGGARGPAGARRPARPSCPRAPGPPPHRESPTQPPTRRGRARPADHSQSLFQRR